MVQVWHHRKSKSILQFCQKQNVKDFFIKFTDKLHVAHLLSQHTLDFVRHGLLGVLIEVDTNHIGGFSDDLAICRLCVGGGLDLGCIHSHFLL